MRPGGQEGDPRVTPRLEPGARKDWPPGFALVAAGRLASNVAFRLVFPFLPRISQGLGVSLSTIGTALSVRELTGLVAPRLGRTVDRRHRSVTMTAGLAILAAAMVLTGASGGLVLFTIALVLTSLAKSLFDIGSSAWVGDAVPFHARSRAIGALETTWAVAFIVGMPIAALAIRLGTWRTPFLVTGLGCGVLAIALTQLPGSAAPPAAAGDRIAWSPLLRGAVLTMTCMGVGQQILLVTFASFLEDEHQLSVSALGLAAIIIGFAELIGSGTAMTTGDRLGKSRGAGLALAAAVPISLAVPVGSTSLTVALVILAGWFAASEFAIVSMMSLFTELDHASRGQSVGMALGGWTIGHAVGAFVGTRAYEEFGMTPTAITMALAYAVAAAVAHFMVFDPDHDGRPSTAGAQ